jgi:hypothetical protein
MSKRLGIISLFIAWLCASGALLDTAQVFAWVRMFAGYTRTMSIETAVIQTMDPNKPCAICKAVRRARDAGRHEKAAATPPAVEQMLLAHVQDEPFVLPPIRSEWPQADPIPIPSWRMPVPVPPPRTHVQGSIG